MGTRNIYTFIQMLLDKYNLIVYINMLVINKIQTPTCLVFAFMANHFDAPNRIADSDFRTIRYRDIISKDHPVRLIEQFVNGLDVSRFEQRYKVGDGQKGRAPKDIKMMLSVLLHGLYSRLYSAHKIDRATQEQADFWFLTNGERISHDKISDFVAMHGDEIYKVFLATIELAHRNQLLDFGTLYQDGFLLKANASKHNCLNQEKLSKRGRKIAQALEGALEQLRSKSEDPKLELISQRLEKKFNRITELRQQLQKKIDERSQGKAPYKSKEIAASTIINTTDPDADLMHQKDDSFAASFLKVCSIDKKADIVVASTVDGYNDEAHKSLPLFQEANQNCAELDGTYDAACADTNFTTAQNCDAFEKAGAQIIGPVRGHEHEQVDEERSPETITTTYDETNHCVYCSQGACLKETERYHDKYKNTTIMVFSNHDACKQCTLRDKCTKSKTGYREVRVDSRWPAQHRTLLKYQSALGRRLYKHRAHVGETYQGDLKHNGKMNQLLRRGLAKAKIDSMLHDIVWNLRRIFNTKGSAVA
jgi:transposase